MRTFRKYLLVSAGFVILAVTGSLMSSRHAVADDRDDPKPVTIVSPLPVPVRDVDVSNPARNAFQAQKSFSVGAGFSEVCSAIATVPSGKRLAVEYAGATVGPVAMGQSVRHVQLRTRLGTDPSAGVFHNLTQSFSNAAAEFVVGQQVRIYGDPTAFVDMCVARLGGTAGAVAVIGTVSGFLVDLP